MLFGQRVLHELRLHLDELRATPPRYGRRAASERFPPPVRAPPPQPGQQIEDANPTGELWIVADNLSSHNSLSTRTWLEDHPRIHHAFIPVGACWLNLQEGWWRIFREAALAGRSFANRDDVEHATTLATRQLNSHATAWIRGRPAPPTRRLRRRYVYIV
ncbi:transposase [Streptomyces sp. NPDC007991]|uniref:transposase n=1 Tax=Streptomyces sp. NPDC007991 TaxID=3364803 RepID=UPI0036EC4E4E